MQEDHDNKENLRHGLVKDESGGLRKITAEESQQLREKERMEIEFDLQFPAEFEYRFQSEQNESKYIWEKMAKKLKTARKQKRIHLMERNITEHRYCCIMRFNPPKSYSLKSLDREIEADDQIIYKLGQKRIALLNQLRRH
ncbi:MAG: hypothetical protein KAS12_01370 [Candidatus Aenigmarchaeota archaeon]|nr:hypothetical protein [Candidatus Aenigmarchaeota archaeon]